MKIGLALGCGAAKGWAHVGVLRALDRLGIRPAVMTGCSVGAFVGAAYINGNLDQLEQWIRGFTSWQVISLMDFSWRKGGLMAGDRVFSVAQKILGPELIEACPIPFAAVATELYSGREVWLQHGSLKDAVRASCAMPGLLAPKRLGQRWLVDGAVVNPVPVSVCRAQGADVVIAVDLMADHHHRMQPIIQSAASAQSQQKSGAEPANDDNSGYSDNLFLSLLGSGRDYLSGIISRAGDGKNPVSPNILAVMSTSMDIMTERLKRSRMAGDPPEIHITPKVGDIGILEFHRAAEAIAAGEAAVERMLPVLREWRLVREDHPPTGK